MDLLVIGAGMAGLRTATLRAAAGDRVLVVDKGRRHGGRMATRRVDDATFDTGALDIAAHGAGLLAALATWERQGTTARVDSSTDDVATSRWRGHPTARSLPTALAEASGAEVRLATTVTSLAVVEGRWHVTLRSGETDMVETADALVLTAPAPQMLALLTAGEGLASPSTLERIAAVRYEPSLVALARPADRTLGPEAVPDVARDTLPAPRPDGGVSLGHVHRNDLTGASGVVALTLRATAASSAAPLDGDRDAAARELALQASATLGIELEVVHVHGWRYAQVVEGVALPALRDDTSGAPLVLAGDLFEARGDVPSDVRPEGVERAFVSGGAAARLLDGTLG